MVTSHGGNSAAMTLVAQELRAQHGLLAVTASWSRLSAAETLFAAEEVRHGIHGGAAETSIMLARYPHSVRNDAIAKFESSSVALEQQYRWLSTQRPAPFAWQAQDLNANGAVGDATRASAEKGEALLAHGARAFCELLADVEGRRDGPQREVPRRDQHGLVVHGGGVLQGAVADQVAQRPDVDG